MSEIFNQVTFSWKGRDFTIPPNRIMGAIASVEEVMTLQEMAASTQTGKVKTARIAIAYAQVLRYAGARGVDSQGNSIEATDDEVYAAMFSVEGQSRAMVALQTLLLMMVPKDLIPTSSKEEVQAKGKAKPAAASSSSKRPTKRQSANGGSGRRSSGN